MSRIPALVESLRASQRRIAALLEPVAGDQDWTPDAASWSFIMEFPQTIVGSRPCPWSSPMPSS